MSGEREEKDAAKKDIFESLMELDITPKNRGLPGSPASYELAAGIREDMTFENYMEMQDVKKLKQEERKLDLEVKRKELKKKEQELKDGPEKKERGPMEIFMEGFKTPEFLVTWNSMAPDARQQVINTVMQMQAMSPQGGAAFGGMMPYMMMLQAQPKSDKNEISAKDLATMFSEGIKAAREAAPPQQNPIETINSVVNLMKPLQDQTSEATRTLFQQQIDALTKSQSQTKGLKDQLGDIKEIVDFFGGGKSDPTVELEIARLNADQNWRLAQMNMEMRKMERESENDATRMNAFSGIAQTIAATAVPKLIGGLDMKEMARRQALDQIGRTGVQSHPATAPKIEKINVTCPNPKCGKAFMIDIDPENPPLECDCPHCKQRMGLNFGEPGTSDDHR